MCLPILNLWCTGWCHTKSQPYKKSVYFASYQLVFLILSCFHAFYTLLLCNTSIVTGYSGSLGGCMIWAILSSFCPVGSMIWLISPSSYLGYKANQEICTMVVTFWPIRFLYWRCINHLYTSCRCINIYTPTSEAMKFYMIMPVSINFRHSDFYDNTFEKVK